MSCAYLDRSSWGLSRNGKTGGFQGVLNTLGFRGPNDGHSRAWGASRMHGFLAAACLLPAFSGCMRVVLDGAVEARNCRDFALC
jgi:hypothetical protein